MNLVFDIEADKLEISEVKTIHCICALDVETEDEYEFVNNGTINNIADGVGLLASAGTLIGHNIIDYDLPVLNRLYDLKFNGVALDTLILSRLMNPDRQNPFTYQGKAKAHSIEVWGHRLGKSPKLQMEDWSVFTPEMLQRCKEDVATNWAVYKALYQEAL